MFRKIACFILAGMSILFFNCDNPFSGNDKSGDDSTVLTADKYEPDNLQTQAKQCFPDSGSQSRTLKKEDIDWVYFNGVSGKSYKIYTTGSTDTKIKVYTSDTTRPITEGDDSPNNFNASVTVNCTSPVRYYVRICGNDANISGSYTLFVTSGAGLDSYEPDSLPMLASMIYTTLSQSRTISEGDIDWVALRDTARDTVLLTASGTCRLAMSLYDSSGTVPLAVSRTTDSIAQIKYYIPLTAQYRVKIYAQSASATGKYTLTYQNSGSGLISGIDSYEPDNTMGSAKFMAGSSSSQIHTLTALDTDWVKIPVQNGKQYVWTLSNSSAQVSLFTKTGTVLAMPNTSITLNSSENDTVYVRIAAYSTLSTLTYTLTLAVLLQPTIPDQYENDNTKPLAKAKCSPVDSFIQDRTLTYTNYTSDTDWVAFPAMANKQYTFNVVASSGSSTIYYYLYNSTSTSYITYGYTSSYNGITYTPTVSDTMFLMIRTSSSIASAYTLSVQGKFSNDSYEPDSTRSLAGSISSSYQNRIILPGDTDWVKYTSISGDTFQVFTSGSTDMKLALYTSSGSTPIAENDDISTTNKNAQINWKAALGGTFYICVTGKTSSISGSYTLQLASTNLGTLTAPDSFENDNSKATARLIRDSILTSEAHSLTTGDTDWVAFPVLAGGTYTFRVSNSSSAYCNMHLYTSKDSLISSYTSSYSPTISYTATRNDTVYLRLSSSYSAIIAKYYLSMTRVAPPTPDSYEDDNSKLKAQFIKDTILSSQIHSLPSYDTDYVALPVVAGGQYTMSISSSASNTMYMYCYSSKDSQLTYSSSYNPYITYTAKKNDTLYYRISSLYSISRYTLSMSRVLPPAPDQYEDDNTKAKSQLIQDSILSNQPHSIFLSDTDWIALPVVNGGQYTLTIGNNTSSNYIYMYCYSSADSQMGYNYSSSTSFSLTLNTKKTDTVFCRITSTSTVPRYTISMVRTLPAGPDQYESDNTKQTARFIKDTLNAEIHSLPSGDTDWVAFPVKTGGYYTITASSSSNYMSMYLYTSKDILLNSRTNYTTPSITYSATQDDTLFCRIIPYSTYSISRYTLTLTSISPDIYEPDNSRGLAKSIKLDSLQLRTLTYQDTDWVKIKVDSGSIYKVSSTSSFYSYLYCYYNNSTSSITSNYGTAPSCQFISTVNDSVAIMVRYYSTGTSYMGPYTLKVNKVLQ